MEREHARGERTRTIVGAERPGESNHARGLLVPSIEVHELVKRFGARTALDGLSLRVAPGEVVALLGSNGAGKSTLLRVLAGILLPNGGWARLAGYDVVRERRRAAAITGAVLAGEHTWYPRLTGRANLEFFGVMRGLTRERASVAAAAEIAVAGLADQADRPVSAYSRGMRALLAIARARLVEPPVLLLDEPGAGLDARATESLIAHLRIERSRRAVLLATHSTAEVTALADRALVLERGRLVAEMPAPLRGSEVMAVVTST